MSSTVSVDDIGGIIMAGKPIGKIAKTPTERQREWRARVRRRKLWAGNPDPAARRREPRREDLDFWPTPPCLTAAMVQHVLPLLRPGPIWECAAGDGHLVEALTAAGRDVIASDIQRQRRDFLQLDFLNDQPPPETQGTIAITNPPFAGSGLLDPFLDRALALLDSGHLAGVVLLQRADSGGTDGRVAIFNRDAFEVTCCWRSRWIPGTRGQPRWWFSWFVWLPGRPGPPVNQRLRRAAVVAPDGLG
jgi:hypothetical protein